MRKLSKIAYYVRQTLFMIKLLRIFIMLYLIACNDTTHKMHSHTLDFGSFSIETPNSWTKIKASGIDSYVGGIAIDNNDTLDFD